MITPVAVILPLLVAAVLIASGIAKLRHPDDLAGWAELGVPRALRRQWLLTLHPWGEMLLGLVLVLIGGPPGGTATLVALALMLWYLVIIVRVIRAGSDASCACFGIRKRITRVTVIRNAWYVLLALGATLVAWGNPLIGGPLAVLDSAEWLWVSGLVATALTVAVTLWPGSSERSDAVQSQGTAAADVELDYVRSHTPAVPVTQADGELVNLRNLSMRGRPLMLLVVSPGCGSCAMVHDRLGDIRALLPEVSVRLLLTDGPDASSWTERDEPQSLHDPHRYVRDSVGALSTPTAVLFGLDGLLAGGPVSGAPAIFEFVDDVYESLHGERPGSPAAQKI